MAPQYTLGRYLCSAYPLSLHTVLIVNLQPSVVLTGKKGNFRFNGGGGEQGKKAVYSSCNLAHSHISIPIAGIGSVSDSDLKHVVVPQYQYVLRDTLFENQLGTQAPRVLRWAATKLEDELGSDPIATAPAGPR